MLPVISVFALAGRFGSIVATAAPEPSLSLEQILHHLDEHDQVMAGSVAGYTCLRKYALENRRFHKTAELSVRMTYTSPGHKKFEVLSEKGSPAIRRRVLKPMLDAEEEASSDAVRPHVRIVAANYEIKLIGPDICQGRPAYLLEISPKTRNRFLIRGRVWIDAKNFGIMRVDATPAHNPSVFTHNIHVTQQSAQFGDLWLPLFNHSDTDSFVFGHTEVTIDSWSYQIVLSTTPSGPDRVELLKQPPRATR
jgi:hypothetical protein